MALSEVRIGVRTKILAIVLVPSLTLLVLSTVAAVYLVTRENEAKEWASRGREAIPTARELLQSVQAERQLTLSVLAGEESAPLNLAPARVRLDSALRLLVSSETEVTELDGKDHNANFMALTDRLNRVRHSVDARQLPPSDAYLFYNRILDLITEGTRTAQQNAPDVEISLGLAEGLRLFVAAEGVARTTALGGTLASAAEPDPAALGEFHDQVGYYHTEVANLSASLEGELGDRLRRLRESPAWRNLATMEAAVAQHVEVSTGSGRSAAPSADRSALPLSMQEWHRASTEVTGVLIDAWLAESNAVQEAAERKTTSAGNRALWSGAAVAAVSLVAFLIALVLANRMIRRLERLRAETLGLTEEQLPTIMQQLSTGDFSGVDQESVKLEFGRDEIGEVARAFEQAHRAAVAGAVREARTREGVKSLFLNIAHRSQVAAHRQLSILDDAERKQEDPSLLDTLFQLDHLATRERRNAENLIILGGGQPGRRWRNPVPLLDVIRSAVSETLDYQRVRVARLPGTLVQGGVVADLIHLFAELVDNAAFFSPPETQVEVTGAVVGKGVVVEINDKGIGMPPEEMARVNELLRTPPDYSVATGSSDSRLGLFVVGQLSSRHGVAVRLSESVYGGVRVVVLIPSPLLATDSDVEPAVVTTGQAVHASNVVTAGPPSPGPGGGSWPPVIGPGR
ncbi:nitrate- and nitrite sensing domain-containing protein [Nocardia sp. NPDC057227]|uniref:sensor histidine kinase n=1 Tax=Nocardia sp. NPDC057227 TaxID=3346056 RepID=UPI003642356F